MKKWGYVVFPALAVAVGGLSGYLSKAGMEEVFPQLEKSSLTPPGIVFPVVWTILYVLMGLGLALVVSKGGAGTGRAVWLWGIQLGVNFLWSLIFFRWQDYLGALVCLGVLWLLIVGMMAAFYRVRPLAAWLQLPYLLWVSFAGYLNYVVWALNG